MLGPLHRSWWTWKRGLLVAGGASALYLFFRKGSGETSAGDGTPPPTPSAVLTVITQRPVVAKPGVTYYGRASVGWPLSIAVTAHAVASKLTSMGFTNVTAYTDAASLPSTWPSDKRSGNVFASGTYSGTAPTALSLPSQVQEVWDYEAAPASP